MSASPESLRRTRLNAAPSPGRVGSSTLTSLLAAELVAREALDLDVLARLGGERGARALDRQVVVAEPRLLQQDDLLVPLAQPALGDLAVHRLGLALLGGLL